jgi:hypothetical protein
MQWRSCSLVFLFAGISTVLSTAASALITIGALGTPEAFDFDAYNFEVLDGLAYVVGSTDTPGPLRVIDVSNPEAPIQLGVLDLAADGGAVGVAVADELAYVAAPLGLRIVDVSNPTVPVKIGGYDTPGDAVDVEVVGPLAYIADATSTSNRGAITTLSISRARVSSRLRSSARTPST